MQIFVRSFWLCMVFILAACKAELYTGLSEREANEMVAALTIAGIPASKTREGRDGGITVEVDEARFAEAMQILNAKGLPQRQYDSMGDIFRKEGFVSSPTEERARMIYALSQELSHTVAEIDGVLSARIHVVLPESDMLGRDVKPSSASVFVRYSPDHNVETFTSQIKLLVANSIEGLIYDNVTVVMVPADVSSDQIAASNAPQFVNIAGIWIHPSSEGRIKIMFGALIVLLLLAMLFGAWPHIKKLRQPQDDGL